MQIEKHNYVRFIMALTITYKTTNVLLEVGTRKGLATGMIKMLKIILYE